MSLPLVFRPEVQPEVDQAYTWYETQRVGLGEDFLSRVDETLARIRNGPETYPVIYRDVRILLTRRFPYGVYYRVESARVLVIAIQHTHRDPRAWQGRA